jgi:hypothetical protein
VVDRAVQVFQRGYHLLDRENLGYYALLCLDMGYKGIYIPGFDVTLLVIQELHIGPELVPLAGKQFPEALQYGYPLIEFRL